MSENQHRKIAGYRELNQTDIDLMNKLKEQERDVLETLNELSHYDDLDQRCIALGRTNIQQGFMWAIRGIAQPTALPPAEPVTDEPEPE